MENVIGNCTNLKDVADLKMPKILEDITFKFARTIYPDMATSCLLGAVLTLVGFAISHKRIKFDEYDDGRNIRNFNIFTINFAPSGVGKDKLYKDICNKILKYIFDFMKEKVEKHIEELKQKIIVDAEKINSPVEKRRYIKEETAKIRNIEHIVSNGTPEGIYQDAKAITGMSIGGMLVSINELGAYISENDDTKNQLLNILYEAFDGDIKSKSIKTANRDENLSNIVVNALLYGDPNYFKEKRVSQLIELMMNNGLARRSFVTFQEHEVLSIKEDIIMEFKHYKNAYYLADKLSKELFEIFNKIPNGAIYKLPETISTSIFLPYVNKIKTKYNSTENHMLRKVIKSKELKALLLSTLCASLNHPDKLIIEKEDFEQAISITEFLSKDFIKFYNYMYDRNDSYGKFFEFLTKNLGKTFTKTELVNNHYKDFGMKREEFRKKHIWDNAIAILKEIAGMKGYELSIDINNGYKIKLLATLKAEKLSDDFKPIDEIIN
ncbi:TPA: hypothetical protein CPT98_06460 [Candidatus Gastranaerophilales bacterium HUM_19]|nr:MAG TPA: hypothetical protein CPT98_06460 [Candidatus Gastranaerophilales bacterium HUM_19]DAB25952.1 MAG TPA: hypothetical protein CPT86_05925 [Candidatus Gastranaerophilales bacterium HUM_23]